MFLMQLWYVKAAANLQELVLKLRIQEKKSEYARNVEDSFNETEIKRKV